ncbi:Bcr/CflA family multidrug efflux MFS transporter [Endozoicomonadaceae bacterium StTr2]
MIKNLDNRRERLLLILTLGALTSLGPLAIDLYLPALPAIAADMGEPLSRIQMTLSAYTVGFAIGQLLYGPLSDRFGRVRVMMPGLVFYILTNILAAFCTDATQLSIVRVLQALSGAAVMVTIPAMIRDLFPREQSAKAMSSIMMVMTTGPLVAPLMGGQLLRFGWQSLFLFLAVAACFTLLLAVLRVKETLKPEQRIEISPRKLVSAYACVLSHRQAMGAMLSQSFFFGGMFAFITGSPFVYIELFGVPAESYGFLFGANIIGISVVNMLNIRLIGRVELFSLLRAGCITAALASSVLLLNAYTHVAGLFGIVVPVVIYVGCMGLTGPNSNAIALSYFPKMAGTANALGGMMRFSIGGLASAAVSGLHNGTAIPMAVVMAFCGLGAVLSLLLMRRPKDIVDDINAEQQEVAA